jgi:hypothetical protein
MMKSKHLALLYFLLSVVITYVFIDSNVVYNSYQIKLIALTIASVVWGIQVVGAFIFLKNKKYLFLREAGKVCFWGSVSLMASVVINYLFAFPLQVQLQVSAINVLLSIILMTFLFTKFLKQLHLSYKWVVVWLLCLSIAVPLQAKLVGLW